jgi:hypothetical protein
LKKVAAPASSFNAEVCPPADPVQPAAPSLPATNLTKQLRLCEDVSEWASLRNQWEAEKSLYSEEENQRILPVFEEVKKRITGKRTK